MVTILQDFEFICESWHHGRILQSANAGGRTRGDEVLPFLAREPAGTFDHSTIVGKVLQEVIY